jgi:stress response protein YsnF
MDAPLPPPPAAYDAPPPATDGGMVRTEEQLRVGTERVAATRVRLVKYVITEEVQITVPLRREEFRIEEVPIDAPDVPGESLTADEGAGASGTTGSGGLPGEIILHTERPVVTVEVVPVERVRLRTEVVQGQDTVSEQVQREQIAVDQHAVPRGPVADTADTADTAQSGGTGPRHAALGDPQA